MRSMLEALQFEPNQSHLTNKNATSYFNELKQCFPIEEYPEKWV